MNKAQKWTIEICLLLIVVSILIQPFNCYRMRYVDNKMLTVFHKSGWKFIGAVNKVGEITGSRNWTLSNKIRFDILILEWIGIIALGGFFFLYFRKNN